MNTMRTWCTLLATVAAIGCQEKPASSVPGAGDAEVGSGDLRTADATDDISLNPQDGTLDVLAPADVEVETPDVSPMDHSPVDNTFIDVAELDTSLSEATPPCTTAEECDDDNPCTDDGCEPGLGCVHGPTVAECDDGDPCTVGDLCMQGACTAGLITLDCDDKNPCTDDSCLTKVGCQHLNNEAPCDDANPCTDGDLCAAGGCLPGPNMCGCLSDKECKEIDDDNLCNGVLVCDESLALPSCVIDPDSVVACDKPDPGDCLAWACDPPTGNCVAVPDDNDGLCDDIDKCTTGDVCSDGVCAGLAIPFCGVGEPCVNWNDCVPGLTCFDGMPGGYCTVLNCTVVPCPDGTLCIPINDGQLDVCMVPCDEDPDCREEDGHCCTAAGGCWCGTEICTAGEPFCVGEKAGTCNACGSALEPGALDCAGQDQFCLDGACVDCVPDCADKECGDDGCGGSCGLCAVGKACSDGLCVCSVSCASDLDCGPYESCSGTIPGSGDKCCAEKLKLFFEGFEGQTPSLPSPTFKYSYATANPWMVKQATDEFGAHTGERSLRYYRVVKDDNYFYRDIWVPSVPPGGQTLLSLFARCTNDKVTWSLDVSLGGKIAVTVTNTTCDGFWHRYIADVSSTPAGKTELKFRILKNITVGAEFLLDDIALLVTACPEPWKCASWKEQSGECWLSSVEPGNCFIDLDCYPTGAANPQVACATCQSAVDNLDWTPDHALCDDNDPATQDVCDTALAKGCVNF